MLTGMEQAINESLTSTGLTPTNCTITDGGYAKIGNLVIVNMRIVPKSGMTASEHIEISGFPAYSGGNRVAFTTQRADAFTATSIRNNGILQIYPSSGAISTDAILCSGVYIV